MLRREDDHVLRRVDDHVLRRKNDYVFWMDEGHGLRREDVSPEKGIRL